MKFSYIDGFLGKYTIPIPNDSFSIGIFNKALNANIFLEDPLLHLTFVSSFGVGVSAEFDSLYGVTTSGTKVDMSLPAMTIAPALTPGQVATSNYTIDSTNNTFRNILNPSPNKVFYNGKITVNPAGTATRSFVFDTSSIALAAQIVLPAYFKIITFSLQDTAALSLPQDTTILDSAQFVMQVINAFPLYSSVQFYFADSNYHILDSLVNPNSNLIPAAPVSANGIVNGSTTKVSSFGLTRDQYDKIASRVKYGLTRGNLNSSGVGAVQIHQTDNINIKLAVRFGVTVSAQGL